jgi:hypothetical protein
MVEEQWELSQDLSREISAILKFNSLFKCVKSDPVASLGVQGRHFFYFAASANHTLDITRSSGFECAGPTSQDAKPRV